ncbi:primase-helicase zinc-binding domain-containing protein [Pseudodesulfovibrio tunisiensis]|uniref:primase-helicase zinc-binding domain-containing protein n=1 Tax=Pseudodesulfovibrio tunisiensis TaxID=463192 RepID=UPI001FB56898|nr:primase-helicase zinc-binding domain-containing protein [Pseudodesulfovibrio tunisiensis]
MPAELVELVRARVGSGFDLAKGARGEFHGPCPACGGTDRFHVFADQTPSGDLAMRAGMNGGYWCRQCGLAGDYVQWLVEIEGWDWTKIFEYLGVEGAQTERSEPVQRAAARPAVTGRPVNELRPLEFPAVAWQEHGEKFVQTCAAALERNARLVRWLEDRGVPLEVAREYRLGWHAGQRQKNNRPPCAYRNRESWALPPATFPDGRPRKSLWLPRGLVIPKVREGQLLGIRIRRPSVDLESGRSRKKYVQVEGSRHGCLITPRARAYVVVESELDALAVIAANVPDVGGCAIGSLSAYPDLEAAEHLKRAVDILQALDFEPQGDGEKQGRKFRTWWLNAFPQCRRAPMPVGKDPGELVQRIGMQGLQSWILSQISPVLRVAAPRPRGRVASAPEPARAAEGAIPRSVRRLDSLMRQLNVPVWRGPDRIGVDLEHPWHYPSGPEADELMRLYFSGEVMDWIGENHNPGRIMPGQLLRTGN